MEKRINKKWVKQDLVSVHQIIVDKAKLLEKVPSSHELIKNGICDEDVVQDMLNELKCIKDLAKKQEYTPIYSDFEHRIHKETQKSFANDPNSKSEYAFIKSNQQSNIGSDYESP